MIRTVNPEFIAERELLATQPDGTVVPFVIRIGKPYPELNGERWACPVWFDGLEPRYADMRGINSVQALSLAFSFSRTMLSHFVERGFIFSWPTGENINAQDILL